MRFIGKIIATLAVLIALGITIVLALLHTRYATPMITQAVNRFTPYTLALDDIRYHIRDPWHLTLQRPALTITDGQPPITANRLSVWFNPSSLLQLQWQFDSILVDEPVVFAKQLSDLAPEAMEASTFALPELRSHRLAISHLNVSTPSLRLKQGELQLDQWHYQPSNPAPWWQQFDGNFQLAADSARWQQWQIQQPLLDGSHRNNQWTLNAFSFDWQNANINGQFDAALDKRSVDIHQLTLSGLQLQDFKLTNEIQQQAYALASQGWQATVRRADILDSSIELPSLSLNHANLSLTNWHWPGTVYSQEDAWLSFNAESGSWRQRPFTDPLLDLSFTPGTVALNGVAVNALEGYWRASGRVTPDALRLDNLTSKGIKWFLPADWTGQLVQAVSPFKQIRIATLNIGYAQLTAADSNTPWYINGLNVNGRDLLIRQQPYFNLWHGSLSATARQASLNTIDLQEPLVEMRSEQGQWQLEQAFLPFKGGLLEATGQWDLNQEGLPWHAALQGDSLPANILPQWLSLPWPAAGRIDATAALQGLGQHYTGLAHSLNGELRATFRDSEVNQGSTTFLQAWHPPAAQESISATAEPTITGSQSEKPTDDTEEKTSLAITPLKIRSDRGRLTIAPLTIKGKDIDASLKGQWDLASPTGQQLELNAKLGCQRLIRRWQDGQQTVSVSTCVGNNM
ncbi:AsmA family protein [Photobacterium sp. DNB23_23_1]